MRRRHFLASLLALPAAVSGALGVKAQPAVADSAEQWSVLTVHTEARQSPQVEAVWTFSRAANVHWTPPPLTTEQRRALDDYYAQQSPPGEVMHSAERPLSFVRPAGGKWRAIWHDDARLYF